MNRQDISKLQTCVLRVSIHCDGCKKKVKKLLQKIEGVHSIKIDAETGKVTVTGNVDPTTLVKKLVKSGKHAEIWSFQKGSSNFQGNMNNQFKNIVQIGNSKLGQNNNHHHKAHNNGGKDQQQQKMGNSYKDPMSMAMAAPPKDQKYVKNNLPEEEFDVSDDEFDEGDEFDDDDYDDECDDDGGGDGDHGFNDVNRGANKMMPMPMMGKGHGPHVPNGMVNVQAINKGWVGSNNKAKGGVIDIPIVMKSKSEISDPKRGNNGKKKGGSGEKSGEGGGKIDPKKGDKSTKDGKGGGGLLGYGKKSVGLFGFGKKKSCKGGECKDGKKGKGKGSTTNNNVSAKGGGKHENGPKKGGGRKDDLHDFSPLEDGFHEINVKKPAKGGKGGGNEGGYGGGGSVSGGLKMGPVGPRGPVNGHPNQFGHMGHVNRLPGQMDRGQMVSGQIGPIAHGGHMGQMGGNLGQMGGNLGQMGNYPIGQMGNIPVAAGLPAQAMMNGGYYQGVGPANPYNQQYMAAMNMMMNQQRAMGGGMHQPMMFGGPFPTMNHASMPPISPARDSYVHYFSDENANSCSIM